MLRIVSLGAGVQSSAMLLMGLHGEFGDVPDAAIFADTTYEPRYVYEWLEFLKQEAEKLRPGFPIHVVRYHGLRSAEQDVLEAPLHFEGNGILRRQCTSKWKVLVLERKARELAGLKPGQRMDNPVVETWMGISADEITRMRESTNRWQVLRYPLIEKRLTRQDCRKWLERNGYPVPSRSACWFCPYRGTREWLELREKDPDSWEKAVRLDETIRNTPGFRSRLYLYSKNIPLSKLSELDKQLDLWEDECRAVCGT